MLLIGDKRFCRAIVQSSPGTALGIFIEIAATKKYDVAVSTFARNIVTEAIANTDSFLFHEVEGHDSGLLGYTKPLSQAMFANFQMVEQIGSMLDPDLSGKGEWVAKQWSAYCRIVLITFRSYVETGGGIHSYALYRAIGYIKDSASDIYKLNGSTESVYRNDATERLRVIIDFIKEAVEIIDKHGVPSHLKIRIRRESSAHYRTFYDYIADMIFEAILTASGVSSPRDTCWWIQHNIVWSDLFGLARLEGKAGKIVAFKLRRLLYDEIMRMNGFPNYKGARILSYCLNVMGLILRHDNLYKRMRPLHLAVLSWTKKHFAAIHAYNSEISEACLVDGFSYDSDNTRLVYTHRYPLRREPSYDYLIVDPIQMPPSTVETKKSEVTVKATRSKRPRKNNDIVPPKIRR